MRKPQAALMLRWIADAWEKVGTNLIIHSLKQRRRKEPCQMPRVVQKIIFSGRRMRITVKLSCPGVHQGQQEHGAIVTASIQAHRVQTDIVSEGVEDEDSDVWSNESYYHNDGTATDKE